MQISRRLCKLAKMQFYAKHCNTVWCNWDRVGVSNVSFSFHSLQRFTWQLQQTLIVCRNREGAASVMQWNWWWSRPNLESALCDTETKIFVWRKFRCEAWYYIHIGRPLFDKSVRYIILYMYQKLYWKSKVVYTNIVLVMLFNLIKYNII